MWEDTPFEKSMKAALRKTGQDGELLIGRYVKAKTTLTGDVYEEIKKKEPNLSDHGPRHIRNVLENIGQLLGDEVKLFTAHELYCLGMVALFHDVGNIYGRKLHNEKIKDIYVHACGDDDKTEMRMVILAARAHTGEASDGTKDTLKDLDEKFYFRSQVRLKEIAAVLRLADELAEGPQRTSRFVLQTMGYDEASNIYHRYGSSVEVNIDRQGRRLALSYNIQVCGNEALEDRHLEATKELLNFAYARMVKLDQERKYCKFYGQRLLAPYIMTSAKFFFWTGVEEHECDLPTIVIDDKVIPGEGARGVVELYPMFDVESITKMLATRGNG